MRSSGGGGVVEAFIAAVDRVGDAQRGRGMKGDYKRGDMFSRMGVRVTAPLCDCRKKVGQ
jgi:hypothetical protein